MNPKSDATASGQSTSTIRTPRASNSWNSHRPKHRAATHTPHRTRSRERSSATVAGQQNKPFNSVFRFNPTTRAYTILHGFNWPNVATADLIQASNGELFAVESNSRL